jgi:hypothetical protein
MPVPVIDSTTSVLSFPQWQTWQYAFVASGTPYNWIINSGSFPPGMDFQAKFAATGNSGTGVVTAAGTAFSEGTLLVFSSLTGGSSLTAGTVIYYATNVAGDTFQLATSPGGAPIALGSTITAAQLYQPGVLNGAASVPGINPVEMIAVNADGDSTPQDFAIGIEAAAASPDSNADVVWDFAGNAIIVQTSSTLNLTPGDPTKPIFTVKEQDDLVIRLRLIKHGSVIDLSVASNGLKLVLKEYEPENQVVMSDGSVQVGTGDNSSLLVHAKFDGDTLADSLEDYEEDTGTSYNALAEFELTFPNPGYAIGGETFVRTSPTFLIQIARDLGETNL